MRQAVGADQPDPGPNDIERRILRNALKLSGTLVRQNPVIGVQIYQPLATCGGYGQVIGSSPTEVALIGQQADARVAEAADDLAGAVAGGIVYYHDLEILHRLV